MSIIAEVEAFLNDGWRPVERVRWTPGERLAAWLKQVWAEMRHCSEQEHVESDCALCNQREPCALWWLPFVSQIANLLLPLAVLAATLRAALRWDADTDRPARRRVGRR